MPKCETTPIGEDIRQIKAKVHLVIAYLSASYLGFKASFVSEQVLKNFSHVILQLEGPKIRKTIYISVQVD